jgi:hypothetical protein
MVFLHPETLARENSVSNADLNQQLQNLQGPVLGPADIAQPLFLLQAQVAAVLDQAVLQIRREREDSQPRPSLRVLLPS